MGVLVTGGCRNVVLRIVADMLGSCVLSYLPLLELLLVLGLTPSCALSPIRGVCCVCIPSICFVRIGMLAIRARSLLMSLVSAVIANNFSVGVNCDVFCSLSCGGCFAVGVVCSFAGDGRVVNVVGCFWLLVSGVVDCVSILRDCVFVVVVRFLLLVNIAFASACICVCMAMLGVRCPSPCSCRQYANRVCIQWSMEHVGSMSPFAVVHGCRSQSGHAQ